MLLLGDCREQMRSLAPNSVDSIVTDPPYHLTSIVKRYGNEAKSNLEQPADKDLGAINAGQYKRLAKGFMGQQWDGGGVAFEPETWAEAYRVLKPGGHLLAFSGSRTYHRMVCAIEDAGFEIRDQIMWVYGSGFPKSHDVSKGIDKAAGVRGHDGARFNAAGVGESNGGSKFRSDHPDYVKPQGITPEAIRWQGWGTALKPSHEPVVVARKPLSEGTVAANVLRWGTGAINVDGCRIPADAGDEPLKWEHGRSMGYHGADDRGPCKALTSPGRWPANLIHDGSDEVVGCFPESGPPCGSAKRADTATENLVYGRITPRAGSNAAYVGDSGSAARFFYCAKASKKDRGDGNVHPTVKPTSLMRYLCRLVTPPGGIVLDPFMGSGSTGRGAVLEGFRFIGIEMSPEYLDIARLRIAEAEREAAEPEERPSPPRKRAQPAEPVLELFA
jgi:DNA modification methylase